MTDTFCGGGAAVCRGMSVTLGISPSGEVAWRLAQVAHRRLIVGIESTIVDCTRGAPVLLRPGGISRAQVEAACGQRLREREELAAPDPRASGTLVAHYAPSAPVRLMDAKALQTALDLLGADAAHIAIYSRAILKTPSARVIRRRMPDDAAATAQQLFAVLREFDAQGVRLIWVETPPETPEWEAVRDRLQRAAAA